MTGSAAKTTRFGHKTGTGDRGDPAGEPQELLVLVLSPGKEGRQAVYYAQNAGSRVLF